MTHRSWHLLPLALSATLSSAATGSEHAYSTDCSPTALQANSLSAQQALQQGKSLRTETLVAAFCARRGHSLSSDTAGQENDEDVDVGVSIR